jgi:predicted nuclease with TOPRIM domain
MDQMQEMRSKVAALESKLDMLESEMSHLHELLQQCGFPEGIYTLKQTAQELLEEGFDGAFVEKPNYLEGF